MNLPNKLTITRMVLTPVFVACFYIPVSWSMYLAGALFVIAYLTDMLDGQIARRMNIVTDFGKLMDPIADKILSAAAMIMLTAVGLLSPIATLITISREFVISGFRLIYANKNKINIYSRNKNKLNDLLISKLFAFTIFLALSNKIGLVWKFT